MTDEIKLRKVGEAEENSLPRGVKLVLVGEKPVFVTRKMGIFMPLPEDEQKKLRDKHIK